MIKSAKEQELKKRFEDAKAKGLVERVEEATVEVIKKSLLRLSDKALDKLFEDEKPKSSEDFDKKLLHLIQGLLDFVVERTKEFDDFKAEVSNKLEKLEESAGTMIEDRKAPENKKS